MTDTENNKPNLAAMPIEQVSGRRRFLGTGAKAAPFVITLASQPALGATCFTPSRALSKNTSLSQMAFAGQCSGAQSPGNYAARQTDTKKGSSYNWPASVPPSTEMHPLFVAGPFGTFTKPMGNSTVSMTLGEAINVEMPGQVHFHLIGAYLNKSGGNNAVIPDNVITKDGILTMWNEYAKKGYYEPTNGVKWYAEDIKSYLISNGIVK